MKATKIMLAVIATFIMTWLTLGLIFYVLSDMTCKDALTNNGIRNLLLFIGWVPALIVGADLEQTL